MIDEMRQMLKVLAQEQQIRDLDMNVCSEFFNEKFFKHTFPMLSNSWSVDPKGKLICSVFPGPEITKFADQS